MIENVSVVLIHYNHYSNKGGEVVEEKNGGVCCHVCLLRCPRCCLYCSEYIFISMRKNAEEAKKLSSNARKIENVQSTVLPKNPINFKTLKKENKDIYAWINIPNTQVDYPIVQAYSEDDDFFTLTITFKKNYDIKRRYLHRKSLIRKISATATP